MKTVSIFGYHGYFDEYGDPVQPVLHIDDVKEIISVVVNNDFMYIEFCVENAESVKSQLLKEFGDLKAKDVQTSERRAEYLCVNLDPKLFCFRIED